MSSEGHVAWVAHSPDTSVKALDRAAVLHIVRGGLDCEPVSDAEIVHATQLRGPAGTLLATIAIDHMMAVPQPGQLEGPGKTGFAAYRQYALVTDKLEGVTGQQPIVIDMAKRQELQKAYKTGQAEARENAAGFIVLLDVVSGLAAEFNVAHTTAESRLEWLRGLADRAEASNNPLFKALPSAASFGQRFPARREAVTQARRLLWYIIGQADVAVGQGV